MRLHWEKQSFLFYHIAVRVEPPTGVWEVKKYFPTAHGNKKGILGVYRAREFVENNDVFGFNQEKS